MTFSLPVRSFSLHVIPITSIFFLLWGTSLWHRGHLPYHWNHIRVFESFLRTSVILLSDSEVLILAYETVIPVLDVLIHTSEARLIFVNHFTLFNILIPVPKIFIPHFDNVVSTYETTLLVLETLVPVSKTILLWRTSPVIHRTLKSLQCFWHISPCPC